MQNYQAPNEQGFFGEHGGVYVAETLIPALQELAQAYADAVATYLVLAISRLSDYSNSLCTWNISRDTLAHLFTRQAIPMVWDFVESNPFSNSAGNFFGQIKWIAKVIECLPVYSSN